MRIYVGGTFDLFHAGHVHFLKQARSFSDDPYLIVALNTDTFAAEYKRPPIMTLGQRMMVVSACRYVDSVIVNFGGRDSKPAIEAARPDLIVHGDDWTGVSYLEQLGVSQEWLDERGILVAYTPYSPHTSTSELIRRCASLS